MRWQNCNKVLIKKETGSFVQRCNHADLSLQLSGELVSYISVQILVRDVVSKKEDYLIK
jgi:hypothetical protein